MYQIIHFKDGMNGTAIIPRTTITRVRICRAGSSVACRASVIVWQTTPSNSSHLLNRSHVQCYLTTWSAAVPDITFIIITLQLLTEQLKFLTRHESVVSAFSVRTINTLECRRPALILISICWTCASRECAVFPTLLLSFVSMLCWFGKTVFVYYQTECTKKTLYKLCYELPC